MGSKTDHGDATGPRSTAPLATAFLDRDLSAFLSVPRTPAAIVLEAAARAEADGTWTAVDACLDAALAAPDPDVSIQGCVLIVAVHRALTQGRTAVVPTLAQRLERLRPHLGDERLVLRCDRLQQDVLASEGRFEDAARHAAGTAARHARGSPPWLHDTSRVFRWSLMAMDVTRAEQALRELEPFAAALAPLGQDIERLRAHYQRVIADHAAILARNGDAHYVATVGAGFLAFVAIEAHRLREARRWIARLREVPGSEDRVRHLELLLACAEGRWRELDAGLAAWLPTAQGHDLIRLRELQLDAALAIRNLPLATAAYRHLDPDDTNTAYLPERIRLAVLADDMPLAATLFARLRSRVTPQMLMFCISHAREWDRLAVARLWMTSVPSTPQMPVSGAPILIGSSPAMTALRAVITACARVDIPVLITGETGTGKEIVARALHHAGCPAGAPFVPLNCAAMGDALAEAELFGHARGAFTGAVDDSGGLIEAAKGGVLFLDEINSLSPRLQGLLLRLLEQGDYRRIGDQTLRRVACRFIVATNQPLEAACAAGSFRPDLRYRLERLTVAVPPLRDRLSDIPELVAHFSASISGQADRLPASRIAEFQSQSWPGNVRELRNAVEQALLLPGMLQPVPSATRPARPAPARAPAMPASPEQARIPGTPSARQRRLRILTMLERMAEIYPADVARETGSNRQTATRDCLVLVQIGLLQRVQRGRHGRVNPFTRPQ